ncbi:hypothetical protein QA640_43270 [Bradyrhizobium sp. CB82]|uniref:hypothetical protein n=1 Tax=Bradyrhizobium sp. CB82 TaxID=3039159 RepID=UPI0024B2609C|nr:hypothetical protein [Bradyrhizobium sp. CB82]WFU40893.1 hypothetical protein QA640_43270 [Bradyrhizobium sp. CB82]
MAVRGTCFVLLLACTSVNPSMALAAAEDTSYTTAAAALAALRAKSGVKTSVQSGWTVIEDAATLSLWSFPPAGHPAYPAAIQRRVMQEGSNVVIKMNVLCEASKPACDALVLEFEKLNGNVRRQMQQ